MTAVQVLHATDRTRVSRLSFGGRSVVLKEPLGPDAQRRLRHELAMLKRVRGIPGIAQLVEEPRYPESISLVDAGTTNLAAVTTPLDGAELIRLGSALAEAVAAVHRRLVMHRDITPANIVISDNGAPCLVDFALATTFDEIRPDSAHHSDIVGTLAYLAPEQTGRTGRPVDQRADLYALGATLYELATGAPPFGFGDPLRLTHDHLARVPVPPTELNPALPRPLSEIILHLLEKEPDNRYQTAEGLLHDVEPLREAGADPTAGPGRIGELDVPLRLLPPSWLAGRDAEAATLEAAFEDALAGRCRAVLVGGRSGVGKTALVDHLRPAVTRRGGWFVAGKFDEYRRDLDFDALHEALRALGRLLLAEPEAELAEVRQRILRAVGANAGLLTAIVPELATLLRVQADAGEPLTAQARAQRAAVQVLRAVASRERPLVVFVDDLQWAGRTPLGAVDLALSEEPVDGLLLVGAYRDGAVGAADHPLTAPLARWRNQSGVQHVWLDNLPTPALVTMVAGMLHADRPAAASLVELIAPLTRGNPYETVELLEALRRDGVVTAAVGGWRWEPAALRAYLGQSEVAEPAAGRLEAMTAASRQLMKAMACLGGRAELSLLQAATGEPAGVVDEHLAPALNEGLLVLEPGTQPAVRFRHDRLRQTVLHRLDPPQRRARQLAMARRLALVPELFPVAAEQYRSVPGAVDDPEERRVAVGLLRRAADRAVLIGDYGLMEAQLTAALRLVDPTDSSTVLDVRTGRHTALFSLGRLEEADEEYRAIERLCPVAVDRAHATAVQVRSLSHRTRFTEAIELGLESLRNCGVIVPAAGRFAAEIDTGFAHLHRWLERTDAADDEARPDLQNPTLLARTRLIDAVLPVAYFVADPALIAWLALTALRILIEHGPSSALIGPAGHAAYHAGVQRGQYAIAYRGLRRIVALGEARGYEPGTSQARHMAAAMTGWFEPIENGVRAAQQAREGLIAGEDLAYVGYTYMLSVPYSMDCAPSLAGLVAETDEGLAFLRRTANEQTGRWLDSYEWLARVLRGESSTAVSEAVPLSRYADDPLALTYAHLCHAIAAAIFGDPAGMAEHSAAAMQLLPALAGFYTIAQVRVLRGLALAEQAHTTHGNERGGLLTELDETASWLADRAADAPDNFLHLLRLLEAERARAVGDFRAAVLAFDAALRAVAGNRRPWHRALISERAARFYLAHGAEDAGRELLVRAREAYAAWGADAKVAQLDWAYPMLRGVASTTTDSGDRRADAAVQSPPVTTGTLDLLGILAASQALSSETSIERLHARVVEVLSAMSGATGVHLVLRSDDDWRGTHGLDAGATPVVAGEQNIGAPTSVLRYVERVREPLVVDDVTRDDRFARDPYFTGVAGCSLLALPVLGRGVLRAVLVLENRLIRGAFTAERLDAVKLIAAQLTVSLDNAQLYAQLTASRARLVATADQTRRRIERDLHDGAQQRLISVGMQARMAQAAVPPGSGELAARLDTLATEADKASDELRELAQGIHPAILAEGGLRPALRALARRSAVPVDVEVHVADRLPEQVEIAAYFAVAEALTNAVKHARATAVTVTVDAVGGVLRVRVGDDGRGGADFGGGSGLIGLKDRVEALGGRFSVHSARDAGTTVDAELPVASPLTVRE